MRFTHVILATVCMGIGGASLATTGCGGDDSSTSSASTSSSTSSGTTDPCLKNANASCFKSACLAIADNATAAKYGLRMSELDVKKPAALASAVIQNVVGKAVEPSTCGLTGTGTFSWLLELDWAGKMIRTGGAKPVADPNSGYTFVNENLMGHMVTPLVGAITITGNSFEVATPTDVVVPIFLDMSGTNLVFLPLKKARLFNATVSADHNCIGAYNSKTYGANKCSYPAFDSGGQLDAYITLADADTVPVMAIGGASLCVFLGNAADATGKKCKDTTKGGDWCSTTNMPADAMCSDSVRLEANFAASAVKIDG